MDVELANEIDLALETLLDKLDKWLIMQPEWPVIFVSSRQQRKEAARLLAKHVMTIPRYEVPEDQLPRPLRRAIIRELSKSAT